MNMIPKLRLLALLTDVLLIILAFILAYFVRVGWIFSSDLPFDAYLKVAALTTLLWSFFLLIFRVYRLQTRWNRWQHYLTLSAGSLAGIAVFALIFFTLYKAYFSRLILVYAYLFGILLLAASHFLFEKLQKHLVKSGKGVIRILILGSNRPAESFIKTLIDSGSHVVPVAILDGYGSSKKSIHGVPVLGKLNLLEETIEKYGIHQIIQVDNLEQTLNIINFCEQKNLGYAMLPSLLGMYRGNSRETIEDQSVIRVRDPKKTWDELLFGI